MVGYLYLSCGVETVDSSRVPNLLLVVCLVGGSVPSAACHVYWVAHTAVCVAIKDDFVGVAAHQKDQGITSDRTWSSIV